MAITTAVLVVILGYLLGSIPCGYIVGQLTRRVDIRVVGDGNMGAANVYRQIGAKSGVVVGVADASKGLLAIIIANLLSVSVPVILVTGLATVAGHNWPIFIGFRGGRGESTAIGVLLALMPKPMLIQLGIAAIPLFATHNVILASAILFIPLPFVAWLFGFSGLLIGYSIALPCVVGLTHFLRTRESLHSADVNNM